MSLIINSAKNGEIYIGLWIFFKAINKLLVTRKAMLSKHFEAPY